MFTFVPSHLGQFVPTIPVGAEVSELPNTRGTPRWIYLQTVTRHEVMDGKVPGVSFESWESVMEEMNIVEHSMDECEQDRNGNTWLADHPLLRFNLIGFLCSYPQERNQIGTGRIKAGPRSLWVQSLGCSFPQIVAQCFSYGCEKLWEEMDDEASDRKGLEICFSFPNTEDVVKYCKRGKIRSR